MSETLEIFGREYTGVTGIKAKDDNGNLVTFIKPEGTLPVSQNGTVDVRQYAYANVAVSGGGGDAWNEPIIRNWDFSNPVNTRGKTSYSSKTTGQTYTINGWGLSSGVVQTCVIATGGIYVQGNSTNMYYQMDVTSSDFTDKTFTLSMLIAGELVTTTFVFTDSTGRKADVTAANVTLWLNKDSATRIAVGFNNNGAGNNSLIQAMKLECGSSQTLAKQVNGIWELVRHQNTDDEIVFIRYMAKNF